MLNIQHYPLVCGYFCKVIKFLLTVRLTISLQIANPFSLLEVSRGETIMTCLMQNDHRNGRAAEWQQLLAHTCAARVYAYTPYTPKRLDTPVLQQTHLLWLRVATLNCFDFMICCILQLRSFLFFTKSHCNFKDALLPWPSCFGNRHWLCNS